MWDYLELVIRTAWSRSADITQGLLFAALVMLGLLHTAGAPKHWIDKATTGIGAGKAALVVLCAVIAARLLLSPYWVWRDEKDAHEQAQARALALESEVQNLTARLERKTNREATVRKLQEFFVASQQITGFGVKTPNELEEFKTAIAQWRHKTSTWISENMTPAGAAFFNDVSGYSTPVPFGYAINRDHYWYVCEISYLRTNLLKLMETDRFDKP